MTEDSRALYLGVDGGFSGTRALLIDGDGRALGYGRGGNANHQGVGLNRALRNVATAVEEACAVAELPTTAIADAHFALSGDDVEDDHEKLTDGLARVWPNLRFTLSNDVWAGLRGGSTSGIGVAVNCGSGTGAVGRNSRGDAVIIPDNGYKLGSSGGGGQIATDAVRAVVRAWDGRGEPTCLTRDVLAITRQPDVPALYLAIYRGRVPKARLRSVTPLVLRAAAAGDAVSISILRRIGEEMGVAAAAVTRRLGMQREAFPFVLTGGTIRTLRSVLVAAAVERARRDAPHCVPTLPLLQPVAGAALSALDIAGAPVTAGHYARLVEQGYGWHPEETFDEVGSRKSEVVSRRIRSWRIRTSQHLS